MTPTTRRHFLQFTGSALAGIGINQLIFQRQAQRYGKALAQSTSRKLALLVGINNYIEYPLEGCLNDVDLQRNLLIHRFGFNPKDILVIPDEEATRQGILTAFEEHLIKQAKPGDVVVYHYSGHGSRIFDPHPIVVEPGQAGLNGTFVPVDGNLPDGYPEVGGTVKDIMGHTLFLLMSALKSENVTVVLDSCFAGGATREERVRSRNGGNNILVSADEKMYQEQWLSRLNMSPEDFVRGYREGVAKGVVLAATAPDQLARELNINGFKAGIFSYLLTHFLWQEDSNIERVFQKILPEIPQRFNQMPRYEVKPGREYHQQSLYFINTPNSTAQAVVTEVKGDTAELWLGGVDLRKVTTGGVRDENLLAASLARPRHLLAYEQPDLFELAAAYGYALAKNHPFIDGNKRTAFAVMATFLLVNGYLLDVPEMDVVQMMERLASDRETQKSLAKWLRENSVLEE